MTAAELIAHLQSLPADMPLVVEGMDGAGYVDLGEIWRVRVKPVKDWACASYADERDSWHEADGEPFAAICLRA